MRRMPGLNGAPVKIPPSAYLQWAEKWYNSIVRIPYALGLVLAVSLAARASDRKNAITIDTRGNYGYQREIAHWLDIGIANRLHWTLALSSGEGFFHADQTPDYSFANPYADGHVQFGMVVLGLRPYFQFFEESEYYPCFHSDAYLAFPLEVSERLNVIPKVFPVRYRYAFKPERNETTFEVILEAELAFPF
jgi:hypothetical protein